MPLNNPKPGPGSVSEYQVSAIPWVTSSLVGTASLSVVEISLPYVTKFFTVKNTTTSSSPAQLAVAFASGGFAKSNYFTLLANESYTGDIRVKTLFFSNSQGGPGNGDVSFFVLAGLTRIPERMFPTITGSWNGTGSFEGVG